MNNLPDFIIIGAGKCGTTSLHDYLDQHPQIYICPQKETNFFIDEATKNKLKRWNPIISIEDYSALFKNASPNQVIGEISTNYYAFPESAQLIHDLLPEVKIIAILRDPTNRAFSEYQMFVRAGHEKRDFAEAISDSQRKSYVKRGLYYSELLPFFDTFDRDKIKICLYEDFNKEPEKFVQDFFQFIEVDDNFMPDMTQRGRTGGLPKNKALNEFLKKPNPVRAAAASILKTFMPLESRQKLKSNIIQANSKKATLFPETRSKLIEFYREDILKLQDLIERDLSAWLE
ncbi:MAG: sulfotransferase [Symploca sp. SIO1C4]|uniref:Sulfotransferase n=1 Tax=Symploca sp. SIO1C4 TaxID=2607765 RepID=A0A6B3NCI9_9CYAN|nr:sulfotransferase [Symploca sp. SIO1C4]